MDEEDAMLEYTASPWNAADVEATGGGGGGGGAGFAAPTGIRQP